MSGADTMTNTEKLGFAVGWMSGTLTTILEQGCLKDEYWENRVRESLETLIEMVGTGVVNAELEEELKNE